MPSVSQLLDTDQWFNGNPVVSDGKDPARQRRQTREQAARSKTGLWGPTHSLSSGEDDEASSRRQHKLPQPAVMPAMKTTTGWMASFTNTPFFKTPTKKTDPPLNYSQGTDSTKSTTGSGSTRQSPVGVKEVTPSPTTKTKPTVSPIIPTSLERMWTTAQTAFSCKEDTTQTNNVLEYVEQVCSPCEPRNLYGNHQEDGSHSISLPEHRNHHGAMPTGTGTGTAVGRSPLGIMRMEAPGERKEEERSGQPQQGETTSNTKAKTIQSSDRSTTSSQQTPAERRRQRHYQRQQRPSAILMELTEEVEVTPEQVLVVSRQNITPSKQQPSVVTPTQPVYPLVNAPMESFTLVREDAQALERSISELTMKSSYGEATAKLAENRRMAYYAVGRHHRNSGRGGNRRCYFTGKLILGGAPFYAGSVQQGLRTLVVFCLPSAIGLPQDKSGGSDNSLRNDSSHSKASSIFDEATATKRTNNNNPMTQPRRPSIMSISRRPSAMSKISSARSIRSVDDSTVDEEMDSNYGLDRDYLLLVLPDPTQTILNSMATRYPAQFETLPVQVRSPDCWRLFVKFCFFSGLPIAEGECHYKCRDDICLDYGEEIILSHEVMEAVNGESAEILKLPNLKTFRYLRKHYNQQSGKLPDHVFQRETWEMVRAEI
jgi:hypothetical protein